MSNPSRGGGLPLRDCPVVLGGRWTLSMTGNELLKNVFPHGGHGRGSEEIILKTMDGEREGKSHPVSNGHMRR